MYSTSWATIKAKFGHNKGPLSGRTQVGLKDKARAELEYRIRRKLPLGVFSKVK